MVVFCMPVTNCRCNDKRDRANVEGVGKFGRPPTPQRQARERGTAYGSIRPFANLIIRASNGWVGILRSFTMSHHSLKRVTMDFICSSNHCIET